MAAATQERERNTLITGAHYHKRWSVFAFFFFRSHEHTSSKSEKARIYELLCLAGMREVKGGAVNIPADQASD